MSTTAQTRAAPRAQKAGTPRSLARQQAMGRWMLLAPGVIWMTLCLVLPMLMMIYVSFWTQTTFSINSTLTLDNWAAFFSTPTYLDSLLTTVRLWFITLALIFVIGYPVAVYIGLFVRDKTVQTSLLVLCVVPFWTSFLIRVLAWRPMLGTDGAVNIILLKLGLIHQPIEALLFTQYSVIIGMVQIYVVFMVGPVAFMVSRIDRSLIEAARDLGAGTARIFFTVILPLSLPGIVVGSIFVSVMVLGEFATPVRTVGGQGQPARQYHRHPGRLTEMGLRLGLWGDPHRAHGGHRRRAPAHRQPAAGDLDARDGKRFFFRKKNQKTFIRGRLRWSGNQFCVDC